MADLAATVALAGYAIGALGGALLFMEFFQLPSYVAYNPDFGYYDVKIAPDEADEFTWIGRTGALLISLAFAVEFLAVLLG